MAHNTSESAEPKRFRWKEWLDGASLIVKLGFLVLIVWVWWQIKHFDPFTTMSHYDTRPDTQTISSIEGNTDITFPASAHDIYVYSNGFQEMSILVRFSMDADELDDFMTSTLCEEPLSRVETKQEPRGDEAFAWWTPYQAEHLKACRGRGNHIHQHIMIDMTDLDVYVVFVSVLIS